MPHSHASLRIGNSNRNRNVGSIREVGAESDRAWILQVQASSMVNVPQGADHA